MSNKRTFVNDYDGKFNELPNNPEGLINKSRLGDIIEEWRNSKFRHPVTFVTHDVPTVPDKTGWESGRGTKILDHVFLYEHQMTMSWAQDISTQYQGCAAFYIGLEQEFYHHKEHSTKLKAGMFSPEELAAWMCLFWNERSSPAFEARSLDSFPNADWVRGSWIPRESALG